MSDHLFQVSRPKLKIVTVNYDTLESVSELRESESYVRHFCPLTNKGHGIS